MIMENKDIIIEMLKTVNRPGIKELISYLENSDFFEAPASSKYHLAEEGGLAKHSLNVYYNLIKLCVNLDISNETIIIISLLHDICKANYSKKSAKNIQNKEGKWVPTETYILDDELPLGHGEKSVMIIQKFIKLTDDEIMAIRWHMGGFVSKEEQMYVSKAFNKSGLTVLLHIADLMATYIDERV